MRPDKKNVSVAVIMPTFCPGDYINEMLNSIDIQQSSTPQENIVITLYIVLNGPKDPYFTRLTASIAKFQHSVKLLYSDKAGVSRARNIALNNCKDEDYIVFVDDDDILSENFISSLVMEAIKSGSDRVIIQSNTRSFYEGGGAYAEHYIGTGMRSVVESGVLNFSLYRYRVFLNTVWGKLYPRRIIEDLRFKEGLAISEDALFLFELSSRIEDIILVPDAYYSVRQREGSAIRKKKSILKIIQDRYRFAHQLTLAYFRQPQSRTLLLYLSRLAASFKLMFQRIRCR